MLVFICTNQHNIFNNIGKYIFGEILYFLPQVPKKIKNFNEISL